MADINYSQLIPEQAGRFIYGLLCGENVSSRE